MLLFCLKPCKFLLFISDEDILKLLLEREEKRERERDRETERQRERERERDIDWLLSCMYPNQGSKSQPEHLP